MAGPQNGESFRQTGGSVSVNLGESYTSTSVTVTNTGGGNALLNQAVANVTAGVLSAADKAKLDGIEAAATGDPTGAEIVAAIDTELGTEVWKGFPSGAIHVASENGDYTTIQEGIDNATTGQTVIVHTGTYNENITFTGAAANVRVVGWPTAQNVIIAGSDDISVRATMSQSSTLREVTVVAPSLSDDPAIDASGLPADNLAVLYNIVVQGNGSNSSLIKGAGGGILAIVGGAHHNGGAAGSVLEITSGVGIADFLITNVGSTVDAVKVSGGNVSIAVLMSQNSTLYSCTSYINLSGGDSEFASVIVPSPSPATNAIRVSGDGVTAEIYGTTLHSTAYDLLVDPTLLGTGSDIRVACRMDFDKFSVPTGYRDTAETDFNFGTVTGWAQYNDTTHTDLSPQSLSSNTREQWTCDAATNIVSYRPGKDEMFASNQLAPTVVGSAYIVRVNMTIDNFSGNPTVICDIDIGSDPFGASSIVITRDTRAIRSGAPRPVSFTFFVYSLDTFVANGGSIGIECTANAEIYDKSILIGRIY